MTDIRPFQSELFDGMDDEEQLEQLKRLAMGEESKRRRNEGIAKVVARSKEEWKDGVRKFIYELPIGTVLTGEDIRLKAQQIVGHPQHHNAWGGMIAGAIKKGWIRETGGAWVNSIDPKAHATRIPQYERIYPET